MELHESGLDTEDPLPSTAHWVAKMIQRIARKVGATVNIEPEFGRVGFITFPDGERPAFFRGAHFSINPLGCVEIATDKAYAAHFLRSFGYNTPREQTFFSEDQCKRMRVDHPRNTESACQYASELGFPVIAKPNDLSQGKLVTKVHGEEDLRKTATKIFAETNVMLVQEFVRGADYRVTVLDGDILSAYQRIPLQVTGDGIHSIRALLSRKQVEFMTAGRDTVIDFDDFRIADKLSRQRLDWDSIPANRVVIPLLDNSNLSTGGEAKDVTNNIHSDYKTLAIQLTKQMGLRFCGVDIMTSNITEPLDPSYRIIEINAAPGMDHYALSGLAELDALYLKVLRAASH